MAGNGGRMGGKNKPLLEIGGMTILENYLRLFKEHDITLVVGYNADKIKEEYPTSVYNNLLYIKNERWAFTNSAHSLALALSFHYGYGSLRETIILDGDLWFDFYPIKHGFYTKPLKESVIYKNGKDCYIDDCKGIFVGIARVTKEQCEEYLTSYPNMCYNSNRYWCNLFNKVETVQCPQNVYEIDTWEDYKKLSAVKG